MVSIILGLIRALSIVVVMCVIAVSVIIIKFMDDNCFDCNDVIYMLREIKNIDAEENDEKEDE